MGWLWNSIHDVFDIEDGSYPEICICGLTSQQVVSGYNFLRSKARRLKGIPTFYSIESHEEVGLDAMGNAAEFVTRRVAKPFHFVISSLKYNNATLYDIGVFVLDNAISIDFKRSLIWGEIEIETLLLIVQEIKGNSTESFLQIGSVDDPTTTRSRINEALIKLQNPDEDW